jgi:hypothetical protein
MAGTSLDKPGHDEEWNGDAVLMNPGVTAWRYRWALFATAGHLPAKMRFVLMPGRDGHKS